MRQILRNWRSVLVPWEFACGMGATGKRLALYHAGLRQVPRCCALQPHIEQRCEPIWSGQSSSDRCPRRNHEEAGGWSKPTISVSLEIHGPARASTGTRCGCSVATDSNGCELHICSQQQNLTAFWLSSSVSIRADATARCCSSRNNDRGVSDARDPSLPLHP